MRWLARLAGENGKGSSRRQTRENYDAERSIRRARDLRRLRLECLEDRMLLANFLVNSTLDTVDASPGDGVARDSSALSQLNCGID